MMNVLATAASASRISRRACGCQRRRGDGPEPAPRLRQIGPEPAVGAAVTLRMSADDGTASVAHRVVASVRVATSTSPLQKHSRSTMLSALEHVANLAL